jgi:hypothetical protein
VCRKLMVTTLLFALYNEQVILGVRSDFEARCLMEGNPF